MAGRRSKCSTRWPSQVAWWSVRSPARRSSPSYTTGCSISSTDCCTTCRSRAARPAALGELLAGGRVLRALAERRADVVVSTYPGSTEVLGRLRRRGRLAVPAVAVITDLAALRFWAHPGADLHLVTQAESIDEVRAIAGPGADVVHVRGLDDPRFADLPSSTAARQALELPPDGQVVVVSGGGWGVGDLGGAVEEALALPGAFVVLLCGSREEVRGALAARFAGAPRVRVLGFIDRMPELLAAADVLIHSTAGLTVMEALVAGCSVISYGWGRGHIRANNRRSRCMGWRRWRATAPSCGPRSASRWPRRRLVTARSSRCRPLRRSCSSASLLRSPAPGSREHGRAPRRRRPRARGRPAGPGGDVQCSPTAAGARRTGIAAWVASTSGPTTVAGNR